MKFTSFIAYCVILSLVFSRLGISQTEFTAPIQFPEGPQFYFEAISFAGDDTSLTRLDVYVDVGYDALHFVNESDVYRANYEVTIGIYDTLDHSVNEKMWSEKIETKEYEKSVSPRESNLSQRSFLLSPGKYVVKVQLTDVETRKTFFRKRPVAIKTFMKGRFNLSDIMLLNSLSFEGGKKVISPNISGDVGNLKDGFSLFFEAYSRLNIDSTLMRVKVVNGHHEVVQSDSFYQVLSGKRTSCFHKIKTTDFVAGDYLVSVEAHPHQVNPDSSTIDALASTSHTFVIRWKGLPASIVDLDIAIDQMIYLVDRGRLDELKRAEGEKKRELFLEYWKKKDPTPGTARNELMDEYYSRIDYANKHFSHFTEGWKSDMGMVFTIFGTPSNVERHPFDSDSKPYEIWTYYELNRQFVFIDQSGFGDYHLQNPIWDVWSTRPR